MSKPKRSDCPIAQTLDLIGDKWTLLVIRDLSLGKRFFNDIRRSPERIATNILASRLSLLTENELVEKFQPKDEPGRDAYRLTKRGKSLEPVMRAIIRWGLANIDGTNTDVADEIIRNRKKR